MLRDMSACLTRLERLNLWGCIRTSRDGVYSVLREAAELKELSLDAVPHSVSTVLVTHGTILILRTCLTYLELLDSSICTLYHYLSLAPVKNSWT